MKHTIKSLHQEIKSRKSKQELTNIMYVIVKDRLHVMKRPEELTNEINNNFRLKTLAKYLPIVINTNNRTRCFKRPKKELFNNYTILNS